MYIGTFYTIPQSIIVETLESDIDTHKLLNKATRILHEKSHPHAGHKSGDRYLSPHNTLTYSCLLR